ncbi:GTP-binding protein [Mesorhizobium sp. M2D.F.Ca.ET.185.01.1.1]|uniref:CobW family GTP-binding protein n=1 Tax=unclassified Mesorhizobium TaxID=325217 RepID=UPI000FCB61A5|nr:MULTISPECIES: GTP-binding protein [unclassified Mesorhizobium]TGP75046.1 GTP-binding protein [bacterium M00.F.Ca.ET.227.01.1.1]TGP85373.1 GTP-binding protein [bacterium M00.F.Ca.ET.221.01.1.1]TGP89799.1 GTP-binding protein [bacterium M00.F.Ca.ET.222.01.1.1]TGU05803.1 GTP-binding protein [bacterium M00.F.Ca.ET.163.01.1.1]TGU25066.1 GTP-binding protein [bacterium M00.F.Ca.ET.156.01.1.1]TGU43606.1 GTP-binding protein [bacterium M00.F.Ca.ET.146.01.1.1]TGV67285.1 GTP-binding protein [Mesorhizo
MSAPDPSSDARIPVTVLTGFLGSGKTTVLNHLLRQPSLAGAAVIVNEFGAVGLDHLLIEASEEQFTLLDNGCICCMVRGDLVATLKELDAKSLAGETPPLSQVIIETTGLADPAPILHTLMAEAELMARFRIGGVVSTVDAVNGATTLAHHSEAAKQIAVADRLLITKTDLVSNEALGGLRQRLEHLAPSVEQTVARNGEVELDLLASLPADAATDVTRIVMRLEAADHHGHDCGPDCHHSHDHHRDTHYGIQSFSFVIDKPVEWGALARWLDYVAALKGEDLLRFKGIVRTTDEPERPLVLHGVQHVFHPPARLDRWPSADRRTRLVFIVRNIERETIARTLVKFAAIDAASIAAPALAAA